ncbi:unnamed protein product [Amaranthus hypochondriacus]
MLDLAVVVVLDECTDIKSAAERISNSGVPFVCLSSLSPSKIIIFFEDEKELVVAMENTSPLRAIFQNIHRWSENDAYLDRLAWIECVGLHPVCWSLENFKKLGEIWGESLKVDHEYNGVNSLTCAKVLVRTRAIEKIQECVKLEWDSGSCVVWVKEVELDDGGNKALLLSSNSAHNEPIEPNEAIYSSDNAKGKGKAEMVWQSKRLVGTCKTGNNDNRELTVIVDNLEVHEDHNILDDRNVNREMQFENPQVLAGMGVTDEQRRINNPVETNTIGKISNMEVLEAVDCMVMLEDVNNLVFQQPTRELPSENTQPWGMENQMMIAMRVDSPEINSFDPISSVEIPIALLSSGNRVACEGLNMMPSNSAPSKRPRGRPKRNVHSLPEPLFVPSTPSNRDNEVVETWNTARLLGIKSSNEGAAISALRKSKRLLILEENIPTG